MSMMVVALRHPNVIATRRQKPKGAFVMQPRSAEPAKRVSALLGHRATDDPWWITNPTGVPAPEGLGGTASAMTGPRCGPVM
jgi:hypothetical protein